MASVTTQSSSSSSSRREEDQRDCLNSGRSRLMFFSSLNRSCVCVCVCRCNTIAYYLNAATYSVTPYPRPGRCWRCGCDFDCDHRRAQGGGVELFSCPLRAITPSRMAAFLLLFLEVEIRQFRTCAAIPSPHHAAISPPSPPHTWPNRLIESGLSSRPPALPLSVYVCCSLCCVVFCCVHYKATSLRPLTEYAIN